MRRVVMPITTTVGGDQRRRRVPARRSLRRDRTGCGGVARNGLRRHAALRSRAATLVAARLWIMLNTTGTNISVATVAKTRPPMTARPSGAFCSPPSPRPSAIGTMPMIIASAVISTGRKRTKPASIAAATGSPSCVEPLAREADDEHAVRGRDAHAHDRAGERRHRQRRAGGEQHPDDAGERRRQRRDDDERIAPGLEVDDDQQVDQHDRAEQAEQQPGERAVHGPHLAEQIDLRAARQAPGHLVDDLLHVGRDRAEVAVLRRGVDLDHRPGCCTARRPRCARARLMSAIAPSVCVAARPAPMIGRFFSAFSESIWYCGVCITIE